MTNKKKTLKQLLLFLLFAFGIAWIPAIIFNKTLGYKEWFEGPYMILALPVSFAPMLGNLLTRKITKEGMKNSLFHLNLKGNLKYYVFAVLYPVAFGILQCATYTTVLGHWDFQEIAERFTLPEIAGSVMMLLPLGPLFAWNTFGEEFGWRAYMNQKMEPLLGTAGTVIVGGILWGVWHLPLTVEGHNFGTEYWGYPYMGIAMMAFDCTVMGVFLMWLTKKTKSIFPAAILHACNNIGLPGIGKCLLSGVGDLAEFDPTIAQQMVCLIPMAVIAAVFTVFMIRDAKKQAKAVGDASA